MWLTTVHWSGTPHRSKQFVEHLQSVSVYSVYFAVIQSGQSVDIAIYHSFSISHTHYNMYVKLFLTQIPCFLSPQQDVAMRQLMLTKSISARSTSIKWNLCLKYLVIYPNTTPLNNNQGVPYSQCLYVCK